MKYLISCLVLPFGISFGQLPETVKHIDSLVAEINAKRFSKTIVVHDTMSAMSGAQEKEIKAYLENGTVKKVVVTFLRSERIREVYFGPGKDYECKVIYIKDYDPVSQGIYAEVYVWERKLVKSIVTDPLNPDEKNKPAKMIERSNYEIIVKAHMK
jgi:hypothetical protein